MPDWPISFIALAVLGIAQYWLTGRFMTALHRDDPSTYDLVADPVDVVASTLGPLRFGLLYMVPKTYEYWELGAEGRRLASRLRLVSFLSILGMLGFCVELFFLVP
jgi:hypothetical protein